MPHPAQVAAWMTRDPSTTHEDTSLFGALDLMQQRNVHRLPVVDGNGAVVGMITRSDIQTAANGAHERADVIFALVGLTVGDVMTREPVTVAAEDTINEAAACMLAHHISGVPIVEGDRLAGILTETDIFRIVAAEWPAEQEPVTP